MNPVLELWGQIVPQLKADAALASLIGPRVYDHVPRSPTSGEVTAQFPFVALGPTFELQDDAEGIEGTDAGIRIEAWSRAVGFTEVRRISDALRRALHMRDFDLAQNAFVQIEHRRTDTMRDPDGLTNHAVLEFAAIIETP